MLRTSCGSDCIMSWVHLFTFLALWHLGRVFPAKILWHGPSAFVRFYQLLIYFQCLHTCIFKVSLYYTFCRCCSKYYRANFIQVSVFICCCVCNWKLELWRKSIDSWLKDVDKWNGLPFCPSFSFLLLSFVKRHQNQFRKFEIEWLGGRGNKLLTVQYWFNILHRNMLYE